MGSATLTAEKLPQVAEWAPHYRSVPPADYAAELAARYAATASDDRRREHGQFFTPLPIARFMAQLAAPTRTSRRLLDPGAGAGILAAALCERLPATAGPVHLDAYEIDPLLAQLCEQALSYTQHWLVGRGVTLTFAVHRRDFVLDNASAIDPHMALFWRRSLPDPYDIAILNPPYFKLQKQDPRARAAAAVVHGQPNIYALFLAITASLLADRGVMVSITPRSFTTGDYFRRFRQYLFSTVTPEAVHLFHSRKDAFRADEVLQENVILRSRRTADRVERRVIVSTSAGVADLRRRAVRRIPTSAVVDPRSRDAVFHIPVDETDDEIIRFVRAWPNTLHRLGLEVSTGPVVAFRATKFLRPGPGASLAPLLWLRHVRAMQVEWPLNPCSKPQHILDTTGSRYLLLPNATYVVLRRFTAKEDRRRLTASPLLAGQLTGPMIGLENHLNYIHRPSGNIAPREAIGLAALLNSALIDRYFRVSNGHTQVNAGDLRALPLPPRDTLLAIGAALEREPILAAGAAEDVVACVLRLPQHLALTRDPTPYAEG